MKRYYIVASLFAYTAIAACSGGGGNVGSAPTPSSGGGGGAAPPLNQSVAFTVKIPAAPAATAKGFGRRPQDVYISPATGSISVRVVAVDGTSLQVPPTASSADVPKTCRPKGCTVPIPNAPAAVGTNTFAVTTFTGTGDQGAVISSGVVNVVVTAGGTIDATIGGSGQLALGGYVASILLSLEKPLKFGVASQSIVVVIPQDAGGATIVGNVQFANPIAVALASSVPGLSLTGTGLQPNGSVVMAGPEGAAAPIALAYNGSTAVIPPPGHALLTANSINGAGATVTAPPLVVLATPSPGVFTPLPVAPKPVASGGTSASSLYVLNATDNTVTEFTEPDKSGQVVETNPRRVFGGATVAGGCRPVLNPPALAVNGITVDARADAFISSTNPCSGPFATADEFGPAAVSGSAPLVGEAPVSDPFGTAPAAVDVGIAFDAKAGTLDVADSSDADALRKFRFPSTTPDPILGSLQNSSGLVPCFAANPAAGSCNPSAISSLSAGSFFDAGQNEITNEFPFAVDPAGALYVATTDETQTIPGQPTGASQIAIVRVSPAHQKTSNPTVADGVYIEGARTDLTQVISLAVDAANHRLWVLASGLNPSSLFPIVDQGLLGNQEYLLAFDLATFDGPSGEYDGPPVAVYGLARFPAARGVSTVPFIPFANSLTAGNGRVYVANALGPAQCLPPYCQNPPAFYNGPEGEIDVYDGSVSGFHLGVPNGMPSTVIYGYDVKAPVGVAFGPRGSVVSVPAAAHR